MSRESMTEQEPSFASWNASAPPADFACRVAVLASQEQGKGKRQRSGLVVPILLVALFVSCGAAAAWDSLSTNRSQALLEEKGPSPLVQDARELDWRSAPSRWEPEPILKVDPPVEFPVSRVKRELVEMEPPAAVEEQKQPPTPLHLPRCECGVSAIICTCIE